MTGRLGGLLPGAKQVLLTAGAVIGALCILTTVGAALFGLRPLVFESGSMSPTIATGDLAIAHEVDASSLERGQVVSVPTGSGTRVTHRIVSVEHRGDQAVLRLRGDANRVADAAPYVVDHADRVLFHLPKVGYVVTWLSGPTGLFVLGLYAAFLLSVLLRRPAAAPAPAPLTSEERVVPPSGSPHRGARGGGDGTRDRLLGGGLGVVLLLGAGAGVATAAVSRPTLAAWRDAASVSGTRLTVYAVPPASGLTCSTSSGQRVVFSWSGSAAGVTYTVHFGDQGATTGAPDTGSSYTFTPANNTSGQFWVTSQATVNGQQWSTDSDRWSYDKVQSKPPTCSRV